MENISIKNVIGTYERMFKLFFRLLYPMIKATFSHPGSYSVLRESIENVDVVNKQLAPNVDLKNMNLEDSVLINVNFKYANLSGVNFKGADLEGANLAYSNLDNANLSGANLKSVNLKGASLLGAVIEGANLEGAYLESTKFFEKQSKAREEVRNNE